MDRKCEVDEVQLLSIIIDAVLDQKGVLRDVKKNDGKSNIKIIRLKSKLRLIF